MNIPYIYITNNININSNFKMTKNKVSLRNKNDEKIISLSEEEVQKLMIDLNIALDRYRMNTGNIVGNKLIEREREIIQRAKYLKQKGITYKHI